MHRTPRAPSALLLVIALVGCVLPPSGTPGDPDAPGLGGDFGPSTVTRAVEVLAESGVPVRVRPGDAPLVGVAEPSLVALMHFQARNLALEANHGGGTLGADIDTVTEAAGGLPASFLIAAWARTAETPGARTARALLGDVAAVDPQQLTIPALVAMLFLADLTRLPAKAGLMPGEGSMPEALRRVADAEAGDFCDAVGSYLAGVLEGIMGAGLEIGPSWLREAIDLYAPLEADPGRIRNAVGALALLAYATSISRPWVALLVANPNAAHYIVAENELAQGTTEFRLALSAGEESIAEEAAECAALADAELAESGVEGSSVLWVTDTLQPHTAEIEGDLEIENRTAVLEYETKNETEEAHRRGTLRTAVARVYAIVERQEIADLEGVVKELLTGGELGVAAPTVVATYERVAPQLRRLLYPAASATVEITWHEEPEPTPTTTPPPTPEPDDSDELGGGTDHCGAGCAASNGDPHLVPVAGGDYDFMATGEYTLLRSSDGSLEIQARQVPAAGSDDVSLNSAIAARVAGRRVALYQRDALAELHIDGAVTAPTAALDLGGGGRLTPYAAGYQLDFPDGTTLWAVPSPVGIDLVVRPSDALRSEGAGLLGPASDEGFGLPLLPDGSVLPAPATEAEAYDLMYGTFGPAWRVTSETSLFDYASGESPETFFIPGFPSRPLTYEDLTAEQLAAGEAACANVTIEVLRRHCIFDVAVTGDTTYVHLYEITFDLVEEGSNGLGPSGPLQPLPTLEPTPVPSPPAGLVTVVRELDGLSGAALGPDGTLYLSVDLPGDPYEVLAVDTASGTVKARLDAAGGGQVEYAAGSVWVKDMLGFAAFPGLFSCSASRLEPATLAIETTVEMECVVTQTLTATDETIWSAKVDEGAETARLRRLDPATNQFGEGVPLPFLNGFFDSSGTTVFYGDFDEGWYRLPPGATAFESVGPAAGRVTVAGEGMWKQLDEGGASFFTSDGAPAATVAFDGQLLGADEEALYVEGFDPEDGSSPLLRVPIDGGAPTELARDAVLATRSGDVRLAFGDNEPFLVGDHAIVKLWTVPTDEAGLVRSLVFQRVPLP